MRGWRDSYRDKKPSPRAGRGPEGLNQGQKGGSSGGLATNFDSQAPSRPRDEPQSDPGTDGAQNLEAVSEPSEASTEVVQISPIMVDGGTTLRISNVSLDHCSPSLRGCIAEVRRKRTPAELAKEARVGRSYFLMLDTAPWQKGDRLRQRFGCNGWATGRHQDRVELHCEGVFHLRFDLKRETVDVQFKAKSLWGMGFRYVASWLILALHRELFDGNEHRLSKLSPRAVLASSFEAGWRVACVELCVDAVGLAWLRRDAANFVGRTKSGTMDSRETDATSWGASQTELAETINIARRAAPVSLCLYQKSTQIEQAKGCDATTYAPTWAAHGWDGRAQVQRVEIRLNRWGLKIEDAKSGDVVDLEHPRSLASPKLLSIAWAYHTTAKRLVIRDDERISRCTVDPRWSIVQSWADVPEHFDASDWRQRREVQRGATKRIIERAESYMTKAPLRRAIAASGWTPELPYLETDGGLLVEDAEEAVRIVRKIIEGQTRIAAEALDGAKALELIEYAAHYQARYEPWLGEEFELFAKHSRAPGSAPWTEDHRPVAPFDPELEKELTRDDGEK